jgi:hypothetical protein
VELFPLLTTYIAFLGASAVHRLRQQQRATQWQRGRGSADLRVTYDSAPASLLHACWILVITLGALYIGSPWLGLLFFVVSFPHFREAADALASVRAGEAFGALLSEPVPAKTWGATGGPARTPIGDDAFDAAVRLDGTVRDALPYLDAPRRDALRRFVEAGGRIVEGRATLRSVGLSLDTAALASALRTLEAFLDAFDHPPVDVAELALRDPDPGIRAHAARLATGLPGQRGRDAAAAILDHAGVDRTDAACLEYIAIGATPVAVAALRWLEDSATSPLDTLQALPSRKGLDDLVDRTRTALRASAAPEAAGRVALSEGDGKLTAARETAGAVDVVRREG